jgi:hypothetical protein
LAGISDFGISDLAGITDYGFGISANQKYFGFGAILNQYYRQDLLKDGLIILYYLICNYLPDF